MIEKIQKAVENPRKITPYLERKVKKTFLTSPGEVYLNHKHGEFTDHFSKDWDNLILLDACRYDTFAKVSDLPGELEWKLSSASATTYWLQNVVGDKSFEDIVYISANPRTSRYKDRFHAVDSVWNWGWDKDLNVAPPEAVTDAALQAYERFPNKRIIVHFMQPHQPYIGEFGREEIDNRTGEQRGRQRALGKQTSGRDWINPWDEFKSGKIPEEDMRKAYIENLEVVLPHVRRLLEEFKEKTVVSSDHGELFGERGWPIPMRYYGHPGEVPAFKLRQVPWLVVEGERKKRIKQGDVDQSDKADEAHVQDRLRQLGYLDG